MNNEDIKILCVDDEQDLLDILKYNLDNAGFTVETAENGNQALELAQTFKPDLVLLDIMMPGPDGYEVCRQIRKNTDLANTTIVFLTAKGDEMDQVLGLELGADDYIQKPFSPRVVLSKVRALLRLSSRSSTEGKKEADTLSAEGLLIDKSKRQVVIDGEETPFLKKEFDLLYFLMNREGLAFSRDNILDEVWGQDSVQVDRTVDVHINRIRKKLGSYSSYIKTIQGIGYKFSADS